MSKKTRIILIIFLCYFTSLFLFELIIGDSNFMRIAEDCNQKGFNTPFPYFTSYMIAGLNHFILVTIIAIICKFIKRLDNTYKKIIYSFPIVTLIFSLPISFLSTIFAKAFHLYGF